MSAEAIANVVADLRHGHTRVADSAMATEPDGRHIAGVALRVARSSGPVVDATSIYRSLVARDEPVYLYEDHPCIAPPWPYATVCYENEHGNVIAMSFASEDRRSVGSMVEERDPRVRPNVEHLGDTQPGPWKPNAPVDWGQVRWVIDTWVWCGGRGGNGPFPTTGPLHLWRFAIYENGEPADLHWVHIVPDYPMERWDMAHLVLLGALNFCNCRNVELVNPMRPRAEARRIARTGIDVHTINVFPAGRATRTGRNDDPVGVPLTSVRGHFARYGPEYGRGLLFGKYAGRFWIPQFARGSKEHGESKADYRLEAG